MLSNSSMEGTPLAHAVASGDGSQAQAVHRQKQQEKEQQAQTTLWQHPFVDVLKHFKMLPGSDWKLNKKQGDVAEYFVSLTHFLIKHLYRPKKSVGEPLALKEQFLLITLSNFRIPMPQLRT
jgi:hypothetical protein